MSVAPQMLTINGRKLLPPVILYAKNNTVDAKKTGPGKWNLSDVTFTSPFKAPRAKSFWAILNFSGQRLNRETFDCFLREIASYGLDLGSLFGTRDVDGYESDKVRRHFDDFKRASVRFILVVLSNTLKTDKRLYNEVKRWGDIEFGIHTLCVLSKVSMILIHCSMASILFSINTPPITEPSKYQS